MSDKAASILGAMRTLAMQPDDAEARTAVESLRTCDIRTLERVLQSGSPTEPLSDAVWNHVGEQLWRRYPPTGPSAEVGAGPRAGSLSDAAAEAIARVYASLPKQSNARHHLLRALAADGGETSLRNFAELLTSDPPEKPEHCDLALVPLFQSRSYPVEAIFPKLLEALERPALAVAVLDLANFLTRSGRAAQHPAKERADQLMALAGQLAQQLARIEESPQRFGDATAIARIVGECTGLLVALCDALALIGDARAIGKLRPVLQLSHRRLRVEAAAALVRLGFQDAKETLAELVAQPVVRSRVLAYAEELGCADGIPEEFRRSASRAVGDLAAWLAQPQQVGRPPDELEVIDSRRRQWPACTEAAVNCYLIRFEYTLPKGKLSGIGISGPVVLCVNADLSHLNIDDIYAAYAGWTTQHDQIKEWTPEELLPAMQARAENCLAELAESGYAKIQLSFVGDFLGLEMVVATAHRGHQAGVLVAAPDRIEWFPRDRWPFSAGEIYAIVKGRRLLAAFNPL